MNSTVWQPPEPDASELEHRFGSSVLMEFIRSHSPSAVLRELIQNEYDAGGRALEVQFRQEGVEIKGVGTPIGRKGWRRLSVTLGTGGTPDFKNAIEEKANGIGSKNFGLRSLFLFGDTIYVRSNGMQTLLDVRHGTPKQPRTDPATAGTPGVRIYVPYRAEPFGKLSAFTISSESDVLNEFAANLSPSLLKLAHHGTGKSLECVTVSSERYNRRIVWKQKVRQLPSSERGTTILARRITMADTESGTTQSEEEIEWQKRFELPAEFRREQVASYFRDRGARIKVGISLRTKRGKLHPDRAAGTLYYPLGVPRSNTGNGVSISAPFEMDADRSDLVDPSTSAFNAWLLELAADMTILLLHKDWFGRFGVSAYHAAGDIGHSTAPTYAKAVGARLKTNPCWPSRSKSGGRKGKLRFAPAKELNVASDSSLNDFLNDDDYLHPDFCELPDSRSLAARYGTREFTLNSLIRLRCVGKDSGDLLSKCDDGQSNYYYTPFPEAWKDLSRQQRCATALDKHRKRLTKENRHDLTTSNTTLSAEGTLIAAKDLWFVPEQISEVCPVPTERRLHPTLAQSEALRSLCKRFNVAKWIEEVALRVKDGEAGEDERLSLYRYLLSKNGRVPRKQVAVVRNSPILLDRNNSWVLPKSITVPGTAGVRQFGRVLHLPHRDYAKDKTLAKALRFKTKITADDIVRFAEVVSAQPEWAQEFEQVLEKSPRLLVPGTIRRLKSVEFIRSNDGRLRSSQSLHVDSATNRACIGPEGPYPVGNAQSLYRKLGCQSSPKAERIVQYLAALQHKGEPPPRPDILYPKLVAALAREKDSHVYEEKEILWVGNRYSAPADTILGAGWNRVFLGIVPTIHSSNSALNRSYQDLGACKQPKQRHWKQFFVSFGESYQERRSSLTKQQKQALRTAYVRCDDMPSLPTDVPWLLDERGHLHTTSDSTLGRVLIEDDLPLGAGLRQAGADVAFVDISDPKTESFFHQRGVKRLTELRRKIRDGVGKRRHAPRWFQETEYLRRLGNAEFGSALIQMAARDFSFNSECSENIQRAVQRLDALEEINFAEDIHAVYRVGQVDVVIPTKYAWIDNRICLTWVRGRPMLEDRLAWLISQESIPDATAHARFADSVFRLLNCKNGSDIQEYLEQRGIKWRPEWSGNDEEGTDYIEEVEEAVLASLRPQANLPASRTNSAVPRSDQAEPTEDWEHDVQVPSFLPPIEEVNPSIVLPTNDWSYAAPGARGGSRNSGDGWSPRSRNEQNDDLAGRRGEEIVYMLEKERVRKLGYSQERVAWVSKGHPASDFDIESVDDDGAKLFIEVKSTTGSDGKFLWSMPEFQRALQERSRYILYRVYRVNQRSPVVRPFRNPISLMAHGALHLDIGSFRAEVQPDA